MESWNKIETLTENYLNCLEEQYAAEQRAIAAKMELDTAKEEVELYLKKELQREQYLD